MIGDKHQVLDKGYIICTDSMGDDLKVVNVAKASYVNRSSLFTERERKLHKYLWDHQHTSPFRHCFLTFEVHMPLFVAAQWEKHQIGCSWNRASGRYIKLEGGSHTPSSWRKQHEKNKQASEGEINNQAHANDIYLGLINHAEQIYNELIKLGVCKEQARFCNLQSQYTTAIWTASLQAIMHFITLREATGAQWEIQEYARVIKEITAHFFPASINLLEQQIKDITL